MNNAVKGSVLIFCKYLKDQGIPQPAFEHVFHKSRKWRFDIAWTNKRIAIEIEGGVYGRGPKCKSCGQKRRGAHSSVTGILRDIEKYNQATVYGWRVIRCTPNQLNSMEFINLVIDFYNQQSLAFKVPNLFGT